MRGGKREGAGRKPGSKSTRTQELEEAAKGGELPKDYMLRVMRDANAEPLRRDKMAVAVAPYLHPRLNSVEVAGEGGGPIKVILSGNDEQL